MADDDRAAKAARAKALLKSHQKKKKATPAASATAPSASDLSHIAGTSEGPPSIASASVLFSQPPSEAPFPDDRSELGWLGDSAPSPFTPPAPELPPAPTPPTPQPTLPPNVKPPPRREPAPSSVPPPPKATPRTSAPATSPPLNGTVKPKEPPEPPKPIEPPVDVAALRATIHDQQQTINLLVADKTSLTASLERMEGIEQRSQESDRLLEEGRLVVESLQSRIADLQREYQLASEKAAALAATETKLSERVQDTERELELTRRNASDLKTQLTQQRARVRQLEEQIEADDRLEQMEKSMKGIQDRAESLEFQLSKVKQTLAKTKSERDAFEEKLSSRDAVEAEWQQKYDALAMQHEDAQTALKDLTSDHDRLNEDHSKLKNQHTSTSQALQTIQQRLSQLTSEHQSTARQLSSAQNELASANRRVSQAEETVNGLQKENVELMDSLNEMRTKIVELNGDKVELSDRIESLERAIRERDDTIAGLEASLDQMNAQIGDLEEEKAAMEKERMRERDMLEQSASEQQRGYMTLQAELTESQRVVKELTSERAAARQALDEMETEVERLRAARDAALGEKDTLNQELDERARSGEEVTRMLGSTREEIESLRTELSLKEEEVVRVTAELEEAKLRASKEEARTATPPPATPNLNEEMMEALKQQHALELSGAQSQLRSMETSLFQEQAKTHALQRRITALEDELHMQKMQHATVHAPPPRLHSPRLPSTLRNTLAAPVSEANGRRASGEFRRASPSPSVRSTHKPEVVVPPNPAIDSALSPEARHKRNVSLSMLKARIDSEMAMRAMGAVNGHTPRIGKLEELEEESHGHWNGHHKRPLTPSRPQFGDETHVFCCASCHGDLVVL